jgi:hypothetical protein
VPCFSTALLHHQSGLTRRLAEGRGDQAAEQAKAYIRPRILAESTGPEMLRAYIESNLEFMRDHRNNVIAMIEIARSAEGRRICYGDTDVVEAVGALTAGDAG